MKRFLDKIIDLAIVFCSLFITSIMLISVIFRYLGHPFMGTEALPRLAFIWLTFIGTAAVSRDRDHVKIVFLRSKLPEKVNIIIANIFDVMIIIFLIIVVQTSLGLMNIQKTIITSSIGISRSLYTLSITIGFLLSIFYYILRFLQVKKNNNIENKDNL